MSRPSFRFFRHLAKNRSLGVIALGVLVTAGLVIYFKMIAPTLSDAAWYDDNYLYRQAIAVTNNGSAQATTYPTQVIVNTATLVTANKLQSDCDDLRFTDQNGSLISYFIEKGCNTATTLIWLYPRTIIAGSSTYFMYYGNSSAAAASQFVANPTGLNLGDGADGAITVSSAKNINTDNMISGRSCADGGDGVNYSTTTSVSGNSIVLSTTPSSGCLVVGDEVLIINLQGTSTDNSNVGKYETARITVISTATLTLNHSVVNTYDGTTQKIMVQRVPNYTNVTVNSSQTLTAIAWNGTKGGVIMFRANGTVSVSGTISASSLGFQTPAATSSNFDKIESFKGTNTGGGSGSAGGGGGAGVIDGEF